MCKYKQLKVLTCDFLDNGMFSTYACFTLRWFAPIWFCPEMVHTAMYHSQDMNMLLYKSDFFNKNVNDLK